MEIGPRWDTQQHNVRDGVECISNSLDQPWQFVENTVACNPADEGWDKLSYHILRCDSSAIQLFQPVKVREACVDNFDMLTALHLPHKTDDGSQQ